MPGVHTETEKLHHAHRATDTQQQAVSTCWQVLGQGFKHHLEWCKGSRRETRGGEPAEGEQEAGGDDKEDDPQQLAAIETSKVHCPGSSRQFLEHSQPYLKHMRRWKQILLWKPASRTV